MARRGLILSEKAATIGVRRTGFGLFADLGTADDPWTRVGRNSPRAASTTRRSHGLAEPADTVRIGDTVQVNVVGIEPERRRLSLSIRQAD